MGVLRKIFKPRKIAGLTTFCYEKYLNAFLKYEGRNVKQPFELYEGPPEFLPPRSPVFIFQAGKNHRLRAIARYIYSFEVEGWKAPPEDVADKLLALYEREGIIAHDTREELVKFCSKKRGVRGVFIFDKIIEIRYSEPSKWIRKRDFIERFKGKQPYAQGFPYRYLSMEDVEKLINLILVRAENGEDIARFLICSFPYGKDIVEKFLISPLKV